MAHSKHQPRTLDAICQLPDSAWLTANEAATYLGTTTAALAIRRSNRSGPLYGKYGLFIRYQKKALDDWIHQSTPDHAMEPGPRSAA